ncbi:MAG: carboxypeptidase regulatory-like domain-containing protein [Bacteroidetes bacterium]|nr:carboxypeptidase regulatory-like domain-containing protein [Bacteroidota bacterium]
MLLTGAPASRASGSVAEHLHYSVLVLDSSHRQPIQLARVSLHRGASLVKGGLSDATGYAEFEDIAPGTYTLTVSFVNYHSYRDSVRLAAGHTVDTVYLAEQLQEEVVVGAEQEAPTLTAIDVRSGVQVVDLERQHLSPTSRMSSVLQQNILGAAKAPSGEIHIRGQHAEYAYYVDGILIPPGVFGGFNEVVEDKVIDHATFYTGALPAEYGGPTAAVIDLVNRVPSGSARLDVETYAGTFLGRDNSAPASLGIGTGTLRPINANGQTISLSNHFGDLGVFLSGNRQESDRRLDAPLPYIYHDHGFDYSGYAKIDYLLGPNDYITSNLNYAKTYTQIPFDPVNEGVKSDLQNTYNSFQTLSYFHTISRENDRESDLFVGAFAREGNLTFTPGRIDPRSFHFADDTVNGYAIAQDRNYTNYGIRLKWNDRFSHELLLSAGLNASVTNGDGRFDALDTSGTIGRTLGTNFHGTDVGVFVQTEYHPFEWTRFDVGVRYDQQIAPDRDAERGVSPRLRWNLYLDDATTCYLSYGKYFIPANIEELRALAVATGSNTTPTLAERDDAYELGVLHSFENGLHLKADIFRKVQLPGVDDETIGSSAIETSVNIAAVKVTGIEMGLSYNPVNDPLSGYINASIIHAYGSGAVTGGFLPIADLGSVSDLDHDQRLSLVASINYEPSSWFANITAMYSSGLSNGNESFAYSSGLFDLNQGAHTTPSWIVNCSIGYTFFIPGGGEIEPSLYLGNIFDNVHPIKGSYFSGAAWEEPRNLQFKVEVHI